MSDYISREAALMAVCRAALPDKTENGIPIANGKRKVSDCVRRIKAIPAADVRPVVLGEWEKTEDFDEYGGGRYVEWTCSECFCKAKGGWAVGDKHIDEPPAWNYCPNCGADMMELKQESKQESKQVGILEEES